MAQVLETTYEGQVLIQTRLYQMFVFFSFTMSKPQNLNTVKSNHRSHQETHEWKNWYSITNDFTCSACIVATMFISAEI